MKKFLNLFALVACFTFLAASASNAQNAVRNSTNCDFIIKVAYGDVATCTVNGTLSAVVPALSQINLAIPATDGILASKGTYVGSSCVYYVSESTCPFPYGTTNTVLCGTGCGTYTAELFTGFGLWLHN